MARMFKTRRYRRYENLLSQHFAPAEAREFSKLHKKYPPLQKMIKQRAAEWARFSKKAAAAGWSDWRRGEEWVKTLKKFYAEERYKVKTDRKTGLSVVTLQNWIVKKDVRGRPTKAKPSPWEWYDAVFQGLPEGEQVGSPRSHRRKPKEPTISLHKIQVQRWINGLKRSIERTSDPAQKAQYKTQIANLQRSLRGA